MAEYTFDMEEQDEKIFKALLVIISKGNDIRGKCYFHKERQRTDIFFGGDDNEVKFINLDWYPNASRFCYNFWVKDLEVELVADF